MSGIRLKGNRSTEWRLRAALVGGGVRGWSMHAHALPGTPDFVFPDLQVVVFVDGCFWHSCPRCARRVPRHNRSYWGPKLRANTARAREVERQLRGRGYAVLRIWEHELKRPQPLQLLLDRLRDIRA